MENEHRPEPLRPTLVPFRERRMGLIDFEKMCSTDKELPWVDRDEEPLGTWVGVGEFSGDVRPRKANGDPLPGLVKGTWEGATALTIVGKDVLGIVGPANRDEPAVWFWVRSSGLAGFSGDTTESASHPSVTVSGVGWSLKLRDIARLDRPCWPRTLDADTSLEADQEASLLGALRTLEVVETGVIRPPQTVRDEADAVSPLPPRQWTEKLARKPVPITGTILLGARGARRMVALDMKCDGKEIPDVVSGAKPVGWWLVSGCTFAGTATPSASGEMLGERASAIIEGPAALAVTEERIIGILAPQSMTRPALWWSWPLTELTVEGHGSQGVLKKRPSAIKIARAGGARDAEGDTLVLKGVSKLHRRIGGQDSFQTGQEDSLLSTLGGAAR